MHDFEEGIKEIMYGCKQKLHLYGNWDCSENMYTSEEWKSIHAVLTSFKGKAHLHFLKLVYHW